MRLTCVFGSLLLVCHCVCGFGGISHTEAQILLKRLDNARGARRAIEACKILVKLSESENGESNGKPVPAVVVAVEEIIVISMRRNHTTRFLNQVESKMQDILILNDQVGSEMDSLRWDARFLFGSSLFKVVTNYLNYELQSISSVKDRLVHVNQELLEQQIQLCLIRCRAALTATLKTINLMQARDITHLRATIRKTFGRFTRPETQELGKTLAVSLSVQQNATVLEDHIKYLRENLAVILKSGVFMVFCFTFKIYICSFIFGVLLTMSTIVWIAIFLQLIDA